MTQSVFGVSRIRDDMLLIYESDEDGNIKVAAALVLNGEGRVREVHLRSSDRGIRMECLRKAIKTNSDVSLDDGSERSVHAELGRLGVLVLDMPYGSIHELFPDVHRELWEKDACELSWDARHAPGSPNGGFGHWDVTFRIKTQQRFRFWSAYSAFDDHDAPPDHPVHFPLRSWGCTVREDGTFLGPLGTGRSVDILSVTVPPARDLYCREGQELTIRVREDRAQTSIFKQNLVDFLRQAIGAAGVGMYVGFAPAAAPPAAPLPGKA